MLPFISENLNTLAAAALVLAAVSFLFNAILLVLFFGLRKKLRIFFQGKDAKNLENVLADFIAKTENLAGKSEALSEKLSFIEGLAKKGLHRVGVVRFNPFGGTGGDMSFCVAALDILNDGFVLSGLYSREGARVYAKPIERGASRYPLSEEEKHAIEKAQGK